MHALSHVCLKTPWKEDGNKGISFRDIENWLNTFKDFHQLIMSLIAPLQRKYHCSERGAA